MKTTRLYTLACRKCSHLFPHMVSTNKGESMARFNASTGVSVAGVHPHDPIKDHDADVHSKDGKVYAVKEVVLVPFKRGVRQR